MGRASRGSKKIYTPNYFVLNKSGSLEKMERFIKKKKNNHIFILHQHIYDYQ